MKIAYVSHYDARDIRSWSGTGSMMAQSLMSHNVELDFLGPLKNVIKPANAVQYAFNKVLLRKEDHPQRDPSFLKGFSRQVETKLVGTGADWVFAPGSFALSHLQTTLPVAMWTDCTFENLLDYYPKFRNLSPRTIRNGHDAEARALNRCDLIFMSSEWAAESARSYYKIPQDRIRIVPFGSNFEITPAELALEPIVRKRVDAMRDTIKVFCAGVDWYRKGIDFAQKVVALLNERGLKADLIVAGCQPGKDVTDLAHVTLKGFISKSTADGKAALRTLFEDSHVLMLPSRAECTAIVFNEAAQFGLPVMTFETGGAASVIEPSANGFLFDTQSRPEQWADVIAELHAQPARYEALCVSSRKEYLERLNWHRSAGIVLDALQSRAARR